ncbi:MAG: NAD-dependent epimerase/dehydratase family protein [Myxococcota bacterium]
MNHQAVILGATGLVGSHIVDALLADPMWTRVICLGRRRTGRTHHKLVEHVVDLWDPPTWTRLVQGDVAFSALGTTRRAAGAKQAQWEVDHDYQLAFATAARMNRVPTFVLISAAGANAHSRLFYPRMKGQLEREIAALVFPRARVLRPSLLDGERAERRFTESAALGVLRPLRRILPAMARPVEASVVAAAAIASAHNEFSGLRLLEALDIFALGAAHVDFAGPAALAPPRSVSYPTPDVPS